MDSNQPYTPQPLPPQPGAPQVGQQSGVAEQSFGEAQAPTAPGAQPVFSSQQHFSRPTPRPLARAQGTPPPPSGVISGSQPALPPQPAFSQPTSPAPSFAPQAPARGQDFVRPAASRPLDVPKTAPRRKNKKLLMIAVAAVLVVALGVGFFIIRNGGDPAIKKAAAQDAKDVTDRSDGKLDLRLLVDKQQNIRAQDLKAKPKQQVNLSDGISYMVTDVQRNFTPQKGSMLKVKDGKELIKVSVVVGNKSQEANIYFVSGYFKLRNHSTGLQSSLSVVPADASDIFKTQNIASGQQATGSIIFEVNKGEEVIGLVTEDAYKDYKTNEDILVRSEVAFQ